MRWTYQVIWKTTNYCLLLYIPSPHFMGYFKVLNVWVKQDPVSTYSNCFSGGDGLSMVPVSEAPPETVHVLATCHALAQLDDDLVGDPLEKATLNACQWTLTKGNIHWILSCKLSIYASILKHFLTHPKAMLRLTTAAASTVNITTCMYHKRQKLLFKNRPTQWMTCQWYHLLSVHNYSHYKMLMLCIICGAAANKLQ